MNANPHLSDEQFYALLDAPTPNEHLQGCDACRTELASIQGSLTDLRGALTQLAATTPLPVFERPIVVVAPVRFGRLKRNALAAGFASVLVVAGGSLAMLHPAHPPATPAVATREVAMSDEALLEGINQDLSTSVPPTLAPLTVNDTAAATTR